MFKTMTDWAHALKRDIAALWLAVRDPRVPLLAKITAASIVAYALSPIDLIPDFIPVLGYLDDLIILPLGIWVVVRLIPAPLMAELRQAALAMPRRPASMAGLAAILLIWTGIALWLLWLFWPGMFRQW